VQGINGLLHWYDLLAESESAYKLGYDSKNRSSVQCLDAPEIVFIVVAIGRPKNGITKFNLNHGDMGSCSRTLRMPNQKRILYNTSMVCVLAKFNNISCFFIVEIARYVINKLIGI